MTPDSEGLKALFSEKFIEKLVDGFVQYRMTVVWCDLIHRFQHKITVLHVDMRNVKIRSVDDLIVIKENVKIQYVAPSGSGVRGWLLLQFMKSVEQFFRSQECTESQDSIQKFILFYTTVRSVTRYLDTASTSQPGVSLSPWIPLSRYFFLSPEVGAESYIGSVPASGDLNGNGIERKPTGAHGFSMRSVIFFNKGSSERSIWQRFSARASRSL